MEKTRKRAKAPQRIINFVQVFYFHGESLSGDWWKRWARCDRMGTRLHPLEIISLHCRKRDSSTKSWAEWTDNDGKLCGNYLKLSRICAFAELHSQQIAGKWRDDSSRTSLWNFYLQRKNFETTLRVLSTPDQSGQSFSVKNSLQRRSTSSVTWESSTKSEFYSANRWITF